MFFHISCILNSPSCADFIVNRFAVLSCSSQGLDDIILYTIHVKYFVYFRLDKLEDKIEAVMKVLPKHEEPDISGIGRGTLCLAQFTLDDKCVCPFVYSILDSFPQCSIH